MDRLGASDGALTRGHEKLEMLSFVEKTARRVDAFPTLMFVRVRVPRSGCSCRRAQQARRALRGFDLGEVVKPHAQGRIGTGESRQRLLRMPFSWSRVSAFARLQSSEVHQAAGAEGMSRNQLGGRGRGRA